jgi:hypothetical protein
MSVDLSHRDISQTATAIGGLSRSLASRFRFAARHFIAYTRRFSAAPFHELVKGLEIRARFAVRKKLRRLQSGKLFSHRCGDELVYACPIFLALSLHRPL